MKRACLLLFIFLILISSAEATTIVKMELAEVIAKSELIVEGTVNKIETRWDSKRRLIFTDVTIEVADRFKGNAPRLVTIKVLGGTLGAITMGVAGMPQFIQGERAIAFLSPQADRRAYDIVGLNQGLYQISQEVAVSNISGVEVFDPKTGRLTRPLFVQSIPVNEFRKALRQLVQNEKH